MREKKSSLLIGQLYWVLMTAVKEMRDMGRANLESTGKID